MTSSRTGPLLLRGWGEVASGSSDVARPRSVDAVRRLLASAHSERSQLCIRGAGRSYGDAALFDGGRVLDLSELRRVRAIDASESRITVESGATIEELWRAAIRVGCWPQVVPGTMRASVGGCVSMHVHGKNQFRDGGFRECIESLEMVVPGGDVLTLRSGSDDALLDAVVGGLGLLGVVTSMTLRLQPVSSGLLDVEGEAHESLGALLTAMDRAAHEAHFLVGWIDGFHESGRGVLHRAQRVERADGGAAGAALSDQQQDLPPRLLRVLPRQSAARLMRPFARPTGVRAINAAKYHAAARRGRHEFRQSHAAFHFLLDYIPDWKRVYRPGGLVQHQSFVPAEHAQSFFADVLERCRRAGVRPWLAVLKRHRDDDVLLTHSLDGYSLALDFPVTPENRTTLWALCRSIDEQLVAVGGRMYAAKDLTATPETFAACHPGLARFRQLKSELDPRGVLTSDLAKRLAVV